MAIDSETKESLVDWEKQVLHILSDKEMINMNTKITSLERADLNKQLFFASMLKSEILKNSINTHLELNKSIDGTFLKIMRDVMRGKIERDGNSLELNNGIPQPLIR